jgi:hypothetical protein
MPETKSTHIVRRGRIFPEIQWNQEQKKQWQAEREKLSQECKIIFEQLKSELIKTHYNAQQAHQKYPNVKLHVFRINETGVCGKI